MARIMIIEDDEKMRSLLKDFIEREGIDADSAPNGSEAFAKLAKGLFDLVIAGIQKSGLAGFDILPAIRRLQPGASVIFVRGFGREEVPRRPSESGGADNLEEPVYFPQLRKLIREIEEAHPARKIGKGVRTEKYTGYSLARQARP